MQGVPSLPEGQDNNPALSSSAPYSSSQPALYSYSCRPGGPADGQCGRLHPCADHRRQDHQVDGGTSAGLNNSNSVCGCPGGRLDLQIRCSGRHHNEQGCAVHLGRLAGTLQATGHRTFSNNSLPPTGQWLSGALPPSTQGLHAGPAGRQGLASTPPLGPAGPSGSS